MSTPITDDLWQARDGETFAYHSARIKDGTARLETDRAALMESTETLSGFVAAVCEHFDIEDDIMLSVTPHNGDAPYKLGLCDAINQAIDALTTARANFPQP